MEAATATINTALKAVVQEFLASHSTTAYAESLTQIDSVMSTPHWDLVRAKERCERLMALELLAVPYKKGQYSAVAELKKVHAIQMAAMEIIGFKDNALASAAKVKTGLQINRTCTWSAHANGLFGGNITKEVDRMLVESVVTEDEDEDDAVVVEKD